MVKQQLPQLFNQGALVIDVRSPGEFASGHFEGSVNIPLPDLTNKIETLDPKRPIVLCCASGGRSGMATTLLKSRGFKDVVNAGPWTNLLR